MTQQSYSDRRLVARTIITDGGGLLFFNGRQGVRGVRVIDISRCGVRLRTHRLAILPIEFNVTWDNFANVHKCRLIWRWDELIGAEFRDLAHLAASKDHRAVPPPFQGDAVV
jgi:hypothetical protein